MSEPLSQEPVHWNDANTETFVHYGHYFVPDRERQIETMAALVPPSDEPFQVLELCCGEGLLAEAILQRFPACTVMGLDGSREMLRRAQARLASFGDRFQTGQFDLGDVDWRRPAHPPRAVVSSLAIHHLDGPGKQALFRDVYRMLGTGGAFIIADVVEPAHALGWQLAADAWDDAVRARAIGVDQSQDAFDFFVRERWNLYRHFDPDDIDKPSRLFDQLQWLAEAGFVDVDVYWMQAGHAIFGGIKPG